MYSDLNLITSEFYPSQLYNCTGTLATSQHTFYDISTTPSNNISWPQNNSTPKLYSSPYNPVHSVKPQTPPQFHNPTSPPPSSHSLNTMPSLPSYPHILQRRYFPNTLPNCTSTHSQTHLDIPHNTAPNTVPNTVSNTAPTTAPNTAPNTTPIATPMMSTARTSNRRIISRPRIQSPNTFFSDYPIPTPRPFTESPPASPSPPIMGAHPLILATHVPTPQSTPQPSQSVEARDDPDVEPPFSPILPLYRSEDERGKKKGKEVKPAVEEFEDDESEWQDAQIRESHLSDREDEGVWVDPLECILGALLAEDQWTVIDGEEDDENDEWVDDEDWHSAETQDEWVEMERVPLSESRDIQQDSQ